MTRSVSKGPFVDGYLLKKAETVRASGDAERDELAGGSPATDADPDPCGPVACPARGPLLRAGRAGERQPVSVHAMLRTVSFTLEVAA